MRKVALSLFSFLIVIGCSLAGSKQLSVEEHARLLHSRILSVDTHCDTPMHLLRPGFNIAEPHDPAGRNSGKIDLPRMREGRLDAEFFAAFVGQGPRTPEGYARARGTADKLIDAILKMTSENPGVIGLALNPDDAYRLKKQGKLTAFIGMENGYPIGLDLSLIKSFYDRGVRYITLCHSWDNDICDSSTDTRDPEDRGLSDFGKKVVAECNRLGMMVDVSHMSDRSFYDVLKASRAPVIASHSSARAVCDSPRNLNDDMLKALKKNGGVIQICFLNDYIKKLPVNQEREQAMKEFKAKYGNINSVGDKALQEKAMAEYDEIDGKYPEPLPTVPDLVDHIDHVKKVIGIDYVGIGTDFDGGGGISGCNDVSGMVHVTEELIRRGYTDDEIGKVWGGNIMRVFRKVIEASGKQGEPSA